MNTSLGTEFGGPSLENQDYLQRDQEQSHRLHEPESPVRLGYFLQSVPIASFER